MHTGVIFSNCFFFGFSTSSGFPSYLDSKGTEMSSPRHELNNQVSKEIISSTLAAE